MLQLGSSRPWPDAMEALTGQRNMDASGVLEYFEPLYDWLKEENKRTGEFVGWEPSTVRKYFLVKSSLYTFLFRNFPLRKYTGVKIVRHI